MHLSTNLTQPANLNYLVEDPLGYDEPDDAIIKTTRRALCRMACVAAETASRFEREGISHDPVGWMLTPRKLFDGAPALDACLDRSAFKRALLLHGLSIGLDADPRMLDDLDDDGDMDIDETRDDDGQYVPAGRLGDTRKPSASDGRLFSATFDSDRGGRIHHGFHASTARSMGEFRARVAGIFGPEALTGAICREGVNPGVRMVEGLVAAELMETLVEAQFGRAGRNVAVTAERVVELDS